MTLQLGCAEYGCVIHARVRVLVRQRVDCCCTHLPTQIGDEPVIEL